MSEENKLIEVESSEFQTIIEEKEARLHELDLLMEEYERLPFLDDLSDEEYKVYLETKKEYKALKKELKNYKPKVKDSELVWDHIPIWMWIFAILAILISVYPVNPLISIYFAQWFLELLPVSIANSNFVFYASMFIIPVVMIATILIIFFRIRKTAKYIKVYYGFMIIMGILLTIGVVTLLRAIL